MWYESTYVVVSDYNLAPYGFSSTIFTVTMLKEQGIAPDLVMVATGAVEREFREINRRTEVGARWSDEGVERVARLLEEVRLNGTRLEL